MPRTVVSPLWSSSLWPQTLNADCPKRMTALCGRRPGQETKVNPLIGKPTETKRAIPIASRLYYPERRRLRWSVPHVIGVSRASRSYGKTPTYGIRTVGLSAGASAGVSTLRRRGNEIRSQSLFRIPQRHQSNSLSWVWQRGCLAKSKDYLGSAICCPIPDARLRAWRGR